MGRQANGSTDADTIAHRYHERRLPTLGLYRIQLLPGRSLLSAEAT
jgi:hypothetical protein